MKDITEGVKHDDDKERFDLIPPMPLIQLAQVYSFGAKKYADRNWENGISWGRIFAAIMRHLWKWWLGDKADDESGLSHLAHAAWGCFALMEYSITHEELDNRPNYLGKTKNSSPKKPKKEANKEIDFGPAHRGFLKNSGEGE